MRRLTALALIAATAALGTGCARVTPGAPSADLGPDAKKLQGTWGIDTFDNGALDKRTEAEKARDLRDMQQVRFRFDGNRLLIVENGREEMFATFALDEAKNPKVMTLTRGRPEFGGGTTTARAGTYRGTSYSTAPRTSTSYSTVRSTYRGTDRGGDGGPARAPELWNWIYKFDGDTLVVAFCRDDKKEIPTEFKARAEAPGAPGVVLITFKKKAAEPDGRSGTNRTTGRYTTSPTTGYRGTSK